jgi:hypothetical protein
MIVIVQAECKSYRVMEASTKISKEGLGGGQATYGGVRTPWRQPERSMCKAVRVRLKM